MRIRLLSLLSLAALFAVTPACLIEVPIATVASSPGADSAKLDILLVIDNSGSMCDEQLALNEAIFGTDCPIQSLNDPGPYLNPSPTVAAELERSCGLAQMLAAYDTDFRLGLITTDVGQCDNRYGFAETQPTLTCAGETVDWGRRPQRGCLQSASTWAQSWLTRDEGDFVRRLREGIGEIGTQGSPFERGLDAVDIFLDPTASRAPTCERHSTDFLRDDARLVIVFATDEDDCSHRDGAFGLPDEGEGESCSHTVEEFYSLRDPDASPSRCYLERDQLAPVADYAARWRARTDGDMSVFVLGGVAPDIAGRPVAAGCRQTSADGFSVQCFESQGSSNLTERHQECAPGAHDEECCTADGATRYMELAGLVDDSDAASICGDFDTAFKRLQDLIVR